MSNRSDSNHFDCIVIGSGTAGATLAKALSSAGRKIMILERGGTAYPSESFVGFAGIADEVTLGEKLTTVRAITTGGSTSLYFAVANYPPLEEFNKLGIDLSGELDAVRAELPIAPLSDGILGEQSIRLRDTARSLGHAWERFDMLVDQSRCEAGYSYEAKWKARSFVDDAVEAGAVLVNGATVTRVIIEDGVAVGVEYRLKKNLFATETRQVRGEKIILSAGELASPQILRNSGVAGVADRGFFCDPGYAIYGLVPGMRGRDNFVGSMGCRLDDAIELGDANVCRTLHRMMMLGSFRLKHLIAYRQCMGIGVKVLDKPGGELKADGRLHKKFTSEEYLKLRKGEDEAVRILKKAGARDIFNFGLTSAGHVGGMIRIQDHVDKYLETQFPNLHVCDGSILPEKVRVTPTLTIICLARYLAGHLLKSFF